MTTALRKTKTSGPNKALPGCVSEHAFFKEKDWLASACYRR